MNTAFITILQKLIAEQGREALLNPAKCKAFLADYTHGEYKKESRLLLQALEAGVQKEIITSVELELCKKQQARVLREEYFLAEEIASDVVDTLALVLRGVTPKEQPVMSQPKPQLIPNPAPAVQTPSPAPITPPQEEKHTKRNLIIAVVVILLFLLFVYYGISTDSDTYTSDVNTYTSDVNTYTSDANTYTAFDSENDFGIDWDTNVSGGVKIIKYTGAKWDVRIPPSIQGYPVTGIGESAFATWTIKSVAIPDSVISIGAKAFQRCINISSITIPDSVTSIGDNSFSGCTSLTSVTIGNSVTYIGNEAFRGCTSLTSVTIPNSVTSIGEWAFSSCTSLTSVTIGNSVTSIGGRAFYYCTSLTSVTIGNSVTSIGGSAFYYCTSLTSVTFEGTITSHNFSLDAFDGDLRDKYFAGGTGTYKRFSGNATWMKQP